MSSSTPDTTAEARLEVAGPDVLVQVNPLLDSWWRPGAVIPSADDLPMLVGPQATSLRLILTRQGKPVSHAALYEHRYRTPDQEIRIGVIGAVATAPEERGRGLAGRLVTELMDRARAGGIDLVVLWSDLHAFYERLGFARAGREIIFAVDRRRLIGLARRYPVRPLRPRERGQVVALHDLEIARTLRTQAEWKAYFALPETDFYVLADGSSIVAYGVVGKGTDLQHCVHEWGGDETALPALIGGIFGLRSESELFVMAAPWKDTAVNAMSYHEIPAHLGVLGMVQLLDPPAFCQRLGVEPALERAGGDHAKLVRLLFGWSDTAPLVPLYLYGLDSM